MSRRSLLLLGLVVVAAAQLAAPAWMIIGRELTLRYGQVFKFRTQPVDPADPFSGRYVQLNLEPGVIEAPDAGAWHYGQKAFAVLDTDTNGFAVVKRLDRAAPAAGPSVPVRIMWPELPKGEVHIRWPGLDRYYLPEHKAPAAERAYWEHNRRTNRTCHVTVRVAGDQAVLEDLFIDDRPILDYLRPEVAR